MKIGRLTASDRASAGSYADLSGPAIETALADVFAGRAVRWERMLVPDDQAAIETALRDLADGRGCALVVTTGGTGPALRRRHTPEQSDLL